MSDTHTLTAETLETLSQILSCYGLKLQNATAHRKIWCLNTSAGYKYLKRTKLNQYDLIFINEAIEYLQANGFNQVPQLIPSHCNQPYVQINNELYVLTDWFEGEELNFDKPDDLIEATQLLAEFHIKAAGFEPSLPNYRTNWYSWPAKLALRIEELNDFRRLAAFEKEESEFSRLYLRYFNPFYRQAINAYQRLLDSFYQIVAYEAYSIKSFCHHDYSARNLLRTKDRRLILIDFDYCIRDLRIHDLINLLVRNLKHNDWEIELCQIILNNYNQISKLEPEEIEVMYCLLCWPQDFWQVGLQYYHEKLPWTKKRFIKKLEQIIDTRFQREQFLQLFPGNNGIFKWQEPVGRQAINS
ncbi:MAG TPA: CotS family spore coat protein [Bacillota bacterium]|nr:CotS family spore coat protein [Bacillota bacterium]HOL08525.1 CotS family spore coat protein [Bacillota bacterium]HPO96994.1 CotS family spore coat protein [Bacillota bacterium]